MSRPPGAPWVAVAGGKGGVGKTLVAVNLAILAARHGYRTLLVDLDPGLANIDVHLRLAPAHTLEDLATERCTPAEALVCGPEGVAILAGRSGSTMLATGGYPLVRAHDAVRRAARGFDLVVCDTGAGIGPAVMETTCQAALTLVVTTPDPAAATDAYAVLKLLLRAHQPAPQLVVNRVRDRAHGLRNATKLAAVAREFLGVELPCAGWLREDTVLGHSVLDQRPFALRDRVSAAGSACLEDLRALTATVLARTAGLRRGAATVTIPACPSPRSAVSLPRS